MFTAFLRRVSTAFVVSFGLFSGLAFAGPVYVGDAYETGYGTYKAIVSYYGDELDAGATSSEVVGEYDTKREARKAARQAARLANGVIGTDCPDGWLC